MAKVVSPGYTPSANTDAPSGIAFTAPAYNWNKDFRKMPSSDGTSVVLQNVRTVLEQPSAFRFAQRPVKDLWADQKLVAPLGANKAGSATLVELREILSVTDEDTGDVAYAPIRGTVSLTLPSSGVTAADVLEFLQRLLGGFTDVIDGNYSPDDYLNSILHGVIGKQTV